VAPGGRGSSASPALPHACAHVCAKHVCLPTTQAYRTHTGVTHTDTRTQASTRSCTPHVCRGVIHTPPCKRTCVHTGRQVSPSSMQTHACTRVCRHRNPVCGDADLPAGITLPCANTHACVHACHAPVCKHTCMSRSRVQTHMRVMLLCANTHACHAPVCKHTRMSCSCVQTHMRVTLPCANTHMCHAPMCKHVHTRARHHTPSGSNRLLAKQHPRAPRPPSNGGGAVPGHPHPSPRTPDPSSPSLHPTES